MRGTGVMALLGSVLVTAACSAPRITTPSPIAEPVPLTTTSRPAPSTMTPPHTTTPPPVPPCAVTTGACVSLAQRLAWLLRDGRVTERYERRASELRARFPDAFDGAGGKPWKHLEREMAAARNG